MSDEAGREWDQYFPTYRFKERDIAIAEYESASRILEQEGKLLIQAGNVAVIVGAAIGSLVIGGSLDRLIGILSDSFLPWHVYVGVILFVCVISIVVCLYFAERQKSVVFAARKVIVLRRMLGLSYGSLRLVLPNWRIEGADEPFAIKTFDGWGNRGAYPLVIIGLVSSSVLLTILPEFLRSIGVFTLDIPYINSVGKYKIAVNGTIVCLWIAVISAFYRSYLFDFHETWMKVLAVNVASFLRVRLVKNFEYVLYRAQLATLEARRVGLDLSAFYEILMFLEDRRFYIHRGVSVRSMVRAMVAFVCRGKRSGASTITQQLARSLFIVHPSPIVRRKIVEILMAKWINGIEDKKKTLDYYLVSVRFDNGVLGVVAAMHHFFGQTVTKVSKAQAFFLIERISNIRGKYIGKKVTENLRNAVRENVLDAKEAEEVLRIYGSTVARGLIEDDERFSVSMSAECIKKMLGS